MKKGILYSCMCGFLLLGCEAVEDLLTFQVNDRAMVRIESAAPLGLPLDIVTPEVTTNSQEEYKNNNTRAELVKDVKLQELKLTITAPSGRTFSFLKDIRIFISTTTENEIELASLENISSVTQTIELNPTREKLDAYAKASSYNLRTQVTTDEALTEAVDLQVDLKFRVTADAF